MSALTIEDLSFSAADGVPLHLRRFRLAGTPRARLLILHGRGEHGGRYEPLAAALEPAGIQCVALDFRGFGRSEGREGVGRGSIRSFDEYLCDIDAALEVVAGRPAPGAPLFLLGHSAGGLAAVRYLEERTERAAAAVAGLVLSSPFIGMASPVPAAKMLIVRALSMVKPDLSLPTSGLPATRDEASWRAYLDDPLTVKAPTARWLTEVVRNQRAALERAAAVKVPLLVLQGGADAASDPAVSRRFAERCGGLYKEYPGALHEVLNELPEERRRALEDLSSWVLERAAPSPSRKPAP